MKTIYLVRHAKAGDHSASHDFERELTPTGNKEAADAGNALADRSVSPDVIITSPAARTLATAKAVAKALGSDEGKLVLDKRIYEAEEKRLLKVLQEVKGDPESVMLVGHNPGITEFTNSLLGAMITSMPTAGVAVGKLRIDKWSDASWGCGSIDYLEFPK